MRLAASVTSLALISSLGAAGCGPMTAQSKRTLVGVGIATLAVGGLAIVNADHEADQAEADCANGDDLDLLCGFGAGMGSALLGTGLLIGGLGIMVGAAASPTADDDVTITPTPRSDYVTRPSDPVSATERARNAWVTHPLPEVATDAVTLRMAQQTRAAALTGNCDAAWATIDKIRERDQPYYHALLETSVLAECR